MYRRKGSAIILEDDVTLHSAFRCNTLISHPVDISTIQSGARVILKRNCGLSGVKIVCATEKGKIQYTKSDYTSPVCIVMGAEDTGIPVEHLRMCDEWVSIPQFGNIESLNVSVATGVLLYEAVRQRHSQD